QRPPADRWWISLRPSRSASLRRLSVAAAPETSMPRARVEMLARARDAARGAAGAPPVSDAAPTAAEAEAAGVALPAGASGADVPSWVRAQLRCPDCGGELRDVEAALQCEGCARVHPVSGGIPVLIAGRTAVG